MRKLIFALAFMLMGTFAFANSSTKDLKVVEYFGTCTVRITEYNGDGTTNTYTYQFETSTEQDCANAALAIYQAHVNKQ